MSHELTPVRFEHAHHGLGAENDPAAYLRREFRLEHLRSRARPPRHRARSRRAQLNGAASATRCSRPDGPPTSTGCGQRTTTSPTRAAGATRSARSSATAGRGPARLGGQARPLRRPARRCSPQLEIDYADRTEVVASATRRSAPAQAPCRERPLRRRGIRRPPRPEGWEPPASTPPDWGAAERRRLGPRHAHRPRRARRSGGSRSSPRWR